MHVQKLNFLEDNRSFDCFLYEANQTPPLNAGSLSEFYSLWKDACSGTRLPSKKDLPFEKFIGWHSRMRIVDYGEGITEPKEPIIIGEKFEEYWGKPIMNQMVRSSNPPPKSTMQNYQEYLQYIYSNHYGLCIGKTPNVHGTSFQVKWIDLPLSDDGKNISHLLSAIIKVDDE